MTLLLLLDGLEALLEVGFIALCRIHSRISCPKSSIDFKSVSASGAPAVTGTVTGTVEGVVKEYTRRAYRDVKSAAVRGQIWPCLLGSC